MTVAFTAKTVGAVAAFKGVVCAFIKTFRMESKGNFPYCKNDNCAGAKAPGEKSRYKNNGRKHHHVVPVEDAAGCAAAVFHKPYPERTPEKNADKIAYIKRNGKNKKHVSADNSGEIESAHSSNEQKPDDSDFKGVAVAFFDIREKIFEAAYVFDFSRNKILYAEF